MTEPNAKNSAAGAELDGAEGAEFLKNLDLALQGQEPEGAHAETVRFGAQLAGVLQSQSAAATSPVLEMKNTAGVSKKASSVVRIDHALVRRSRIGLLDWVAIAAILVLGVLIWRGLESTNKPGAEDPKNVLSAEDGKAPKFEAPKLEPKALDPKVAELKEKLKRQVTFEFVDTPISEAMQFMQSLTNVSIIINPKIHAELAAMKEKDKKSSEPTITLKVENISAELAIQWMVRQAGLNVEIRDNVLFVTRGIAPPPVELRVLNVKDCPVSAKGLAKVFLNLPFEHPFESPDTSLEAMGSLLRITQTANVYNDIATIVGKLITERDAPSFEIKNEMPEWEKTLRERLKNKKITFEFQDTPGDEALRFLQMQSGIPMLLDKEILRNVPPISLRVTDMSMDRALQWILQLTDLDYQYEHQAICIVPRANVRIPTYFTAYNIGGLLKQYTIEGTAVVDMIRNIEPQKWDYSLGTAAEYAEGWLFVIQTAEIHAKVKQGLAKLEKPDSPRVPGTK